MEDPVAQDARVVDHRVDAPEALDRAFDDARRAGRIGHAVGVGHRLSARSADLVDHLLRGAGAVNGQIFSVRNNEISLISQPRPVRSIHRSEGWTPQSIAEHAMPAIRASFYPLDRSADVFSWDPV